MLHPCNKGTAKLCHYRSLYVERICSFIDSCHGLCVKAVPAGFLFFMLLLQGCVRPMHIAASIGRSLPVYTAAIAASYKTPVVQEPVAGIAGDGQASFLYYSHVLLLLSILCCLHISWGLILLFFHKVKKNPPGHVAYTRMQRHILQKIILSKIG